MEFVSSFEWAPKLTFYAKHHLLPAPGGGLAKQPRRPIPRTILALQKPAPIGAFIQQDPHGFAKGPGQMRKGTIDGNHQVEIGDNRRRVGEALQFLRKVERTVGL